MVLIAIPIPIDLPGVPSIEDRAKIEAKYKALQSVVAVKVHKGGGACRRCQ